MKSEEKEAGRKRTKSGSNRLLFHLGKKNKTNRSELLVVMEKLHVGEDNKDQRGDRRREKTTIC